MAWVVVAVLMPVGLLNYLDRQMLASMKESVMHDIPSIASEQNWGYMLGQFKWVYAVFSLLGGYLADRFSRRYTICTSLFVWSVVTWLTGHVTTYNELLIVRSLMGVSEAFYIPAALALIADYHTGHTRSRAVGLHQMAIYCGVILGGWTSGNGLQQAKDQHIGQAKPDLVIIAFGMNDVFQRNADAYQANIRALMDTIRAESPDTEFVLVASMLGNSEWGMPMDQFPLYRDALAKLCGPGVALVDMTAMWEAFLKRKTFYDLTGNGVNHPNDFGHCVYAQSVLATLIEAPKP